MRVSPTGQQLRRDNIALLVLPTVGKLCIRLDMLRYGAVGWARSCSSTRNVRRYLPAALREMPAARSNCVTDISGTYTWRARGTSGMAGGGASAGASA